MIPYMYPPFHRIWILLIAPNNILSSISKNSLPKWLPKGSRTNYSIGFQNFWCLRRFWATLNFDAPPTHTHTNINTRPSECVLFGCGFEFYLLTLTNISQEPMFYLKQKLTIIVRKFWVSVSKQECIPVGCVPPAAVAICWGVCLSACWDPNPPPPPVWAWTPPGVDLDTPPTRPPQHPPGCGPGDSPPQGSSNLFTNSMDCRQTGGWHLTEMPSC